MAWGRFLVSEILRKWFIVSGLLCMGGCRLIDWFAANWFVFFVWLIDWLLDCLFVCLIDWLIDWLLHRWCSFLFILCGWDSSTVSFLFCNKLGWIGLWHSLSVCEHYGVISHSCLDVLFFVDLSELVLTCVRSFDWLIDWLRSLSTSAWGRLRRRCESCLLQQILTFHCGKLFFSIIFGGILFAVTV